MGIRAVKTISTLLSWLQLFFGVAENTKPTGITKENNSTEIITTLAISINHLLGTTKAETTLESGRKQFESYLKDSNEIFVRSLEEISVTYKAHVGLCLRIMDIPGRDIDEFVEKCLEVSSNTKIFKNTAIFMLETFLGVNSENMYRKFVNIVLNNDQMKRKRILEKIRNTLNLDRDTKNWLTSAIYDGIARLVIINEDVEYVLNSITFELDDDDTSTDTCDEFKRDEDAKQEMHNNTSTQGDDDIIQCKNKSTNRQICIVTKPLPITSFVMKHHLKEIGITISDIKVFGFKNIMFTTGSNFFDFIGDQFLPDGCKVFFQKCQFPDNIIRISDTDAMKMKNVKILHTHGCRTNNVDSSILKLKNLENLLYSGDRFRKIPDVILEMTWLRCLSLSECKITDIPADITKLVDLKRLLLSNNELQEISPYILELTNLETLVVNFNKITEIPDDLIKIKGLRVLNISRNLIKRISVDFSQFPLEELRIGFNPLETIPKSIYEIGSLKVLNVRDLPPEIFPSTLSLNLNSLESLIMFRNKLISLEFLKKLPKLKKLSLEFCELNKIADDSFVFTNLTELSLCGNGFTKIPQPVFKTKSLEMLNLSRNDLTDISEEIKNLIALKSLNISNNKFSGNRSLEYICNVLPNLTCLDISRNWNVKPHIEDMQLVLPDNLSNLRELSILHLEDCCIAELPNCICEMVKLEKLYLNNNRLSELPANFGNLLKLKDINLKTNSFTEVPVQLKVMKRLTQLIMSKNKIDSIPVWMDALENLSIIHIDENQICNINDSSKLPRHLKVLNCRRNKLTVFPISICKLRMAQVIDISKNEINGTLPREIGSMFNLKKLSIQGNKLKGVVPEKLANVQTLIYLNISDNNFTKLPDNIGNMSNLRVLNMSRNLITRIPWSFYNIHTLEHMNASFNCIGALDSRVGTIKSLVYLNIHQTRTKIIPDEIMQLTHLTFLDFGSNFIDKLSDGIGNLTELETLICNYNLLTELPSTIGNMKRLTNLSVSNNQIVSLPYSIGDLLTLEKLDIRWNNMTYELPSSFENLKSLVNFKFQGNRIPNVHKYLKTITERRCKDERSKSISNTEVNTKLRTNGIQNTGALCRSNYNFETVMRNEVAVENNMNGIPECASTSGMHTIEPNQAHQPVYNIAPNQWNTGYQHPTQPFAICTDQRPICYNYPPQYPIQPNPTQPFAIHIDQQPIYYNHPPQYPIQPNPTQPFAINIDQRPIYYNHPPQYPILVYNNYPGQFQNYNLQSNVSQPSQCYFLSIQSNLASEYNMWPIEYNFTPQYFAPLQLNYPLSGTTDMRANESTILLDVNPFVQVCVDQSHPPNSDVVVSGDLHNIDTIGQ